MNDKEIQDYLLKSEKGRLLLHRCMDEEMPHFLVTSRGMDWLEKMQSPVRTKVLLAIHGDGYTEVHADRPVSINSVKIPDSVTMTSEQMEACEWIATKDLSLGWQRVYQRGKVVAALHTRPMRPSDYIRQEHGKADMDIVKEAGKLSRRSDCEGARSATTG